MNNIKLISNFLRYLTDRGISASSLKYYKSDITNFLIWKKDREISGGLIKEYLNSIRLTTPNSTINRRLSTLRSYSLFISNNFMQGIENVSNNKISTFKESTKTPLAYRFIQEYILKIFKRSEKVQNALYKLFFNRPSWYKKYHTYPLANYIHIAILILFSSISGYAVYDQVFYSTDRSLAFPTTLERPNRFLSFQGRLTDNLGNPKTTATNMVFKLYAVSSGGSALWNSGTCSITPDQDGIFSTLLGSSCGSEIASSVFSENADIWLGVTAGADAEATPRIQIATVAYALNSETLQGFPAGTGTSTIPYIDSTGTVVLASGSPKIQSTSGTFAVEGQALTITTPNTSNGVITVNPDGTGTLNLTFEGAAPGGGANGFVNATNANITSGSLYSGTVASNASGYNFINFLSGSSPISVFSVQNDGDIITSGDITIGGGNINTGNIALTIGDATTDTITLLTDGTGNGELILPNDSIGPDEMLSTGQVDEYCLTYETGDTFEWQSCASVSGTAWSDITNPTGDLTLSMSTNNTTFNWDPGANNAETSFVLSIQGEDTIGSDEDQVLMALTQTDNGVDVTEAADSLLTLTNNDGNDPVNNGIRFDAGSSGTDFTYGINFDAATFATAELILSNLETIDNLNDGTIALSGDLAINGGNITTAFTADSSVTITGTLTANGDVNFAVPDGSTVNIDGDGSPTSDLILIGNSDTSTTTGVDALTLAFGSSNASGDLIHLIPSFAGGATDGLTFNVFEIDPFSVSNSSGTDILNGLKLGNLTDPGATITSTALNIGSGWDSVLTVNGTTVINGSGQITAGQISGTLINTTSDSGSSTLVQNDTLAINGGTNGIDTSLSGDTYTLDLDTTEIGTTTFGSGSGMTWTFDASGGTDPTIAFGNGSFGLSGTLATTGVLQVGSLTTTTYSRLGTGTTGHGGNISASSDLLLQDIEIDGTLFLDGGTIANSAGTASIILSGTPTTTSNTLSASNWLVENTANVGQAALMVNQTKAGDLFTASASGVTRFTVQNDGDVVLTNGQLRLGNLSSAPTAEGAGSMYFNTTTNQHQCYNGTNWYNCGGTLYSNTNASVADGSYITVAHNLASADLLSSAWINAQGVWKSLDASYRPAIAWEGKDTQKGVYHDSVNSYISNGGETGVGTSTYHEGMVFDTFEDTTKTDSANTTASYNNQLGDDGSANFATLDQRIQGGRVGLSGGQTFATSETDNDGQTYLGSNTVNDTFYYDRAKDSTPEVLVELGIDPNWYNGVTLSIATSSAQYSQAGTLADKNPNLTTTYNGSLIKATGTDSTPRTIYITIKSPTTFDWTNYQGDASTGVTITPGTAQSLGSTGVSVTFTGGVNYNVGDVFKVASWFIEGESSTRGARQSFPERAHIVGSGATSSLHVDIIDADTQKLWMRFSSNGGVYAGSANMLLSNSTGGVTAVTMLNGQLYIGKNGGTSDDGFDVARFNSDSGESYYSASTYRYSGNIATRNTQLTPAYVAISTQKTVITNIINDVDATVIPNQPTQEMTVSGWGYIQGDGVSLTLTETVNLPYNFNTEPKVQFSLAGLTTTVAPTSLSSCGAASGGVVGGVGSITKNTFGAAIRHNDNTTILSSSFYICYTWTATGSVSPKQFVAVATGATSADGGTTIINETDGTKATVLDGSLSGLTLRTTKIAIADNAIYNAVSTTTPATSLQVHYNLHGLNNASTVVAYRGGYYYINQSNTTWSQTGPVFLGAAAENEIKSLVVTPRTSTADANSSTIYVGTTTGVSVIQEKRGLMNNIAGTERNGLENTGTVKYYTKDYISDEMIGDIRGMWPLNNSNTASDFEDISIKANTLTGTNITASGDSVSGVRGTATDFDGSTESMTRADDADLDFTASELFSLGIWFRHNGAISTNPDYIMTKADTTNGGYKMYMQSNGTVCVAIDDDASFTPDDSACSSARFDDSSWHHMVGVKNATTSLSLYVDGHLVASDTSIAATGTLANANAFYIGVDRDGTSNEWDGYLDEAYVTATAITDNQIKHMYQVGARALESHGTGLSSGSADGNQTLAGASNNIGVVAPDYNNQYMYVGSNHTTDGALTKIQLNSDTAIKNWDTGDNDPDGGAQIVDDDITSLAVGETLYAVGSAGSGVKSMGLDDNATSTSGNFVSRTYTLPKNIGSAVLWASPVLDASDGSNTLTVQASNDGGSNYVTCTLVGTNSNYTVPEKEYACTFTTADNDLKVRFQFARGSTKTSTYVVQYGISWLGETGFRVEQADSNNVRLYNFSGETQNLKLNVTGASTAALANPWTDGGSYLYPTGFESLRIYDGAGTNYLGIRHDGTNGVLTYNGTDLINLTSTGDLLPETDDTQTLGSNSLRWKDIYLGPGSMHIGTSTTDEGVISYDTSGNILNFDTDTTSNGDIAFFGNDLYLDKSTGRVGIGTTSPGTMLDVLQTDSTANAFRVKTGQSQENFTIASSGYTVMRPPKFDRVFSCSGASCTSADSGTFTNNTTEASTTRGTAFTAIATGTTATFYVGLDNKFDATTINMNTKAVGLTLVIEYWNGSSWTALSVTDSTSNLTVNSTISWSKPSSWTTNTVNGYSAYWIRLRSSSNVTTAPTIYATNSTPAVLLDLYSSYADSYSSLRVFSIQNASALDMTKGSMDTDHQIFRALTHDTSSSTEYFASFASDVDGSYDNEFIFRTDGTAQADGSFTGGGADVAEYYYIEGQAEEGDLVSIPSSAITQRAGKTVEKSRGNQYDNQVIGIVSTNPGLVAGGGNAEKDNTYSNQKPIALAGRVPVKVSLQNGEIKKGDHLTSSSIPGVAMKATQAGTVIGQALEDYDGSQTLSEGTQIVETERLNLSPENESLPLPQSGTGKIMAFVKTSWFDPGISLANNGDIVLNGDQNNSYAVTQNDIELNNRQGFAEALIAKAIVGLGKFKQIETETISPIANTDLIIDLDPENNNNSSSKFAIKGNNDQEVASIDANGNAEFDGKVVLNNLLVDNNATISGTLYADNIKSTRLEEIENLLNEVEENQQLLANSNNWNINTATESANIITETIQTEDLLVTNLATFSSISLTNSLFFGTDFIFQTTDNSINTLIEPLRIQSLAMAQVEIMAGKITVDTNGDTKFLGNVEIAGNLKVNGNFVVASDTESTDEEQPEIIEGQINSNSTAGKATLVANSSELRIVNNKIKDNSLIYVTPVSSTQNKVLYVKSKAEGEFVVGFSESIDTDVEFNWWVIELGTANEATESGEIL